MTRQNIRASALIPTLAALTLTLAPTIAGAETPANPAPPPVTIPARPPVTLDLRDAPIRDALQQFFDTEKVDYIIESGVEGYATLKLTNQPFEAALRLLLRSSSVPLTYVKENGTFIIRRRHIEPDPPVRNQPVPDPRVIVGDTSKWATISLTYLDPADVAQLLHITIISTFTRQGGGARSAAGTTGSAAAPSIAPGAPGRVSF